MALTALMRRMAVDAVPHGFRSTFRDWAAETTDFPGEVVEIEARVKRLRSRMGQLDGFARVNNRIVVSGTMTFALGPRQHTAEPD